MLAVWFLHQLMDSGSTAIGFTYGPLSEVEQKEPYFRESFKTGEALICTPWAFVPKLTL
jgi:hypothetical protein